MDDNNINARTDSSSVKKFAIPAAVLVIIVIAAISLYTTQANKLPIQQETTNTQAGAPTGAMRAQQYKNGTYTVTGNYVSPGGPRDIGVTLTLADGVVTDATFEGRATDPTSKRFQGEFGANFKPQVIGKNIEDLKLVKVSGSSLTPKGFNDALKKIKNEAAQS